MSVHLDQTLFTQEEPLFESGASSLTQPPTKEKRSPSPKTLIIIAVVVIVGLITLLSVIGMMIQRPSAPVLVSPSPSPTPLPVKQDDQIEQLFRELQDDIDAADPTENLYPFPPVEPVIRITPTQR